MKLQLFSLDQAPRSLPLWQTILDDLGQPHPARVAKLLGVGARTVYRWNRAGHAPRSAALALFWLTRWGRSAIDCQAVNDALVAVALARGLEAERDALRDQLAHVLALNESGAANEPIALLGVRRRRLP
jgi:predicted DNA-binding transcriptional regulator AlpA